MKVVWIAVSQESGNGLGDFLVGKDVPEAIGAHHQDVVCAVLVLREVVHLHL